MAAVARPKDRLAEDVLEREDKLREARRSFEHLWQSVARYVIPRKATFLEEVTPGVERNRYVLDSTAQRSLELFASFLFVLMNNPSRQWFRLRPLDGERDRMRVEERQHLERVERRILEEISARSVAAYQALHEVYLGQGAFGTSVMFEEMRPDLRVRQFHLADCVVDEGESGEVDSLIRRARPSKRQVQQRWPDFDLGAAGRRLKATQTIPVRHAVVPSDDDLAQGVPAAIRRQSPFVSVWLHAEERRRIAVGTFEEFPYQVPRWYRTTEELYGRSPAMTVLADIRMANRMKETILRGAEKLVDPPLVIPDGGLVSPVRMHPGGLSYSDGNWEPRPLIPPGASRIEVGDALLQQTQQAIREGFFVPFFVTPDSPVKTATQVLQETDERNRAVSPMLIRAQSELFHPFILRVHNLLQRAGRLPPAPERMAGMELAVEYVSPLQASQRQLEALGTLRVIESALPWAQVDPGILDAYDPDEVAKVIQAGSGAPDSIMRDEATIRRVREARRQEQQRQELMERLPELTKAVEAGARVQAAQAKPGGR